MWYLRHGATACEKSTAQHNSKLPNTISRAPKCTRISSQFRVLTKSLVVMTDAPAHSEGVRPFPLGLEKGNEIRIIIRLPAMIKKGHVCSFTTYSVHTLCLALSTPLVPQHMEFASAYQCVRYHANTAITCGASGAIQFEREF